MTLIDDSKKIIFQAEEEMEGRNYKEIKNKYTKLYILVNKGVKHKKEFSGYYQISKERKYLDAIQIPGTQYYIVSSILVHNYLGPVLEKLKNMKVQK